MLSVFRLQLAALAIVCAVGCDRRADESASGAEPATAASASPAETKPAPVSHAQHSGGSELPDGWQGPGALALDADLRALLIEEMTEIDAGLQRLISHLARGELAQVAALADRIRTSFVLVQALSEEQHARLVAALPGEFLVLDRAFHGGAGELADAARRGDAAAAAERAGELLQLCVTCHRGFARARFPGLALGIE